MIYTKETLDKQIQFQQFITMVSPSLKLRVTTYILGGAIKMNDAFEDEPAATDMVVTHLEIYQPNPEERIVNIGEHSDRLYFIAFGDFEVFVKDQHGIETFVHFLDKGELFGEVGLITSNP